VTNGDVVVTVVLVWSVRDRMSLDRLPVMFWGFWWFPSIYSERFLKC